MKRMIYYAIAGWIATLIVQAIGGNWGLGFVASMIVPPILIIAYILYRSKGTNDRTYHEHWTAKRDHTRL